MDNLELRTIKLDLINACNERCHFCPYYGTNGSVINNAGQRIETFSKLELGVLEQMFDDLAKAGMLPQIKISGWGEGMLHPQFGRIVEKANFHGFEVRVITNGTKILDHQKAIEDNVSVLVVSIHGNRLVHDEIVSKKGAYESAIDGVRRLHKTGKHLQNIVLAYVITPQNIPYMVGHVNLCYQLGVEARFQHNFIANNHTCPLNLGSLQDAIAAVRFINPAIKFIPDLPASLLPPYYSQERFVLNPYRCDHIAREIEIRANGEVYCCRSDVFGNINQSSITDIIRNSKRNLFLTVIQNETRLIDGLNKEKCDKCCYQGNYVMLS